MESPAPVQPEKKKNNTLIIVIVALLVACCCGILIIVGVVALGRSLLDFSKMQPEIPSITVPEGSGPVEEPYDASIPQGGLGNNDLRLRVWNFITPMAKDDAGCENPVPAATVIAITEGLKDGVWTEDWTLFCENGTMSVYRIVFSTNSDGTINFSPAAISMEAPVVAPHAP